MQEEELMPAAELCRYYQVDISFILSLDEFGLIALQQIGNRPFIHRDALEDLEKYIHLHYDLNINLEGLDAIQHLLRKVSDMQQELIILRNRLTMYE